MCMRAVASVRPDFDAMCYSLPGSSVHGVLQARILQWGPFPSPGHLLYPGIKPGSPALQADSSPSEPLGSNNSSFPTLFGGGTRAQPCVLLPL